MSPNAIIFSDLLIYVWIESELISISPREDSELHAEAEEHDQHSTPDANGALALFLPVKSVLQSLVPKPECKTLHATGIGSAWVNNKFIVEF